jgi:hypothetical protein
MSRAKLWKSSGITETAYSVFDGSAKVSNWHGRC